MKFLRTILVAATAAIAFGAAHAADPGYFTKYDGMRMSRNGAGVLLVEMNTKGGPIKFSAREHEQFVDAFYDIGRDRGNKVVILTGAGGQWMGDIDFASFGNVADPDVWSKVHDEGTQIVENIANIRVPMICAVEGKAWVHTEYCLLANVIVAGNGATFHDAPHFAGGIVPGDGIFTTWSYRVGPTRAEAMLLAPKPLSAATAKEWGAVTEVVPDGRATSRAYEIAADYLKKPEVTLRNTRIHFVQPLKLALVQQTGYGLSLEGASASALVKSFNASK
ncbi:enoyl-CoA hydratase/isomerase family protein [Roseateles depolymerans]|uniref:Putative 6-oxocamphor hydrolase n=1 Tax=Roseateles depolymerans TaxID=76731 RepID=A0A0U3MJL3_9BURK|nr:enoyl-CoA hydratase/isomerase family protein [Roseateles depolymerans]ALV04522.1 Putative 6-oxocamphor hydrolase [Roseateles depolymerans]REG14054.1 enoyl-CoA hydratase/carnithine racemase [Roseateles depolymerans]